MLGLRERKKARTKAAIQREALRLFSKQGYAETSVDQIAAAAEVSPSTFFRYFATKEDVVLTDFMDNRAIDRLLAAPPELGPLAALGFALESLAAEMDEEEMRLEQLRNELIQAVPELRRGMIAEMIRPMQLFTEALATRLGREPDDPDLVLFAGAAIGALTITGAQEADRIATGDLGAEMISLARDRLTRLERILILPPQGEG